MDLQFLYEYQQQENNYNKILLKISEIKDDEKINMLKDEYSRLKKDYVSLSSKKTDIEKEIFQKNASYKRLQESKANYEKLMYSPEINSIKKLETLKKQIDEADKNISIEKGQIENLKKSLAELDEEISKTKKKLAFIKKKYDAAKEEKENKLNFLLKEKNMVEELLQEIKLKIDDKTYNEYMKMKGRLNNPIAEIENRKCSGCGMEVPAMDYEEIKTGKTLKCQNCGRILLYRKKK